MRRNRYGKYSTVQYSTMKKRTARPRDMNDAIKINQINQITYISQLTDYQGGFRPISVSVSVMDRIFLLVKEEGGFLFWFIGMGGGGGQGGRMGRDRGQINIGRSGRQRAERLPRQEIHVRGRRLDILHIYGTLRDLYQIEVVQYMLEKHGQNA